MDFFFGLVASYGDRTSIFPRIKRTMVQIEIYLGKKRVEIISNSNI